VDGAVHLQVGEAVEVIPFSAVVRARLDPDL